MDSGSNPMTPRRGLALLATLLVAGSFAFLAPGVGPAMDSLYARIDPARAYLSTENPVLLYLRMPLAVLGSTILFLAPGLVLALVLGSARSLGGWLVRGFALSLLLLSAAASVIQALSGEPLTSTRFLLVPLALTLVAGGLLWRRLEGGARIPWPVRRPGHLVGIALGATALLIGLTPKLFWESFNGDGAHAYEATRLLLHHPLPFWPEGSGIVGEFPGINSLLFAYPGSWYLRTFGEFEAAARLPFVLYVALVHALVLALVDAEDRPLGRAAHGLVWLGVASYALVMAFSATYDPYCADIALPATQDTLLVLSFLGAVHAFLRREHAWLALFALLTLLSSPAGPLLLGSWGLACALGFRPTPWRRLLNYGAIAVAMLAALAFLPHVLALAGLPTPGDEHAAGALSEKFSHLLPWRWRRLAFLVVPAGIYPVVGMLAWPRLDDLGRTLTLVALMAFGTYAILAFVSLHYFAPVMLLPLIVFWRTQRPQAWKRPVATLAACLVCTLFALGLALPRSRAIYTAARDIGESIDVSGVPGYEDMDPAASRATQLLCELFSSDAHPLVPARFYGGSPLSWNYYARTRPGARPVNYVLSLPSVNGPPGASAIARDESATVYVLNETLWQEQRSLHPAGSPGHPIYAIPRGLMFGRQAALERYPVIDLTP